MRASVIANRDYVISEIDNRIYGAFLEHLGRAIYSGIYEPDHPTADKNGMRADVAELVRGLDVPMVRYPGGNFVSAYNWEDGIGPREQRPTRLDLAWHTSESNQVGIHEFADWCETVGTQMMLAVNLGSRGLEEARNFVEYVNGPTGSYWGDLRKKNGRADPWYVKMWCLGNEMDGPWQIGHKTADEYGRLASETAKALRAFDSSLELIACGSSHSNMPTYPEWERVVLEHTYETVDHISLHMYSSNYDKHTPGYLAHNVKLEAYISTVAATIDYVKAKKRSNRQVTIAFDEWNVWYHSRKQDRAILDGKHGWPHAPALLEDIYNFEDVLQVGCCLNTFIRKSDVVKLACIAQLVNVIAPIMTEPGGRSWKQTTYYPLYFASMFGRGRALNLVARCPSYEVELIGEIPYLDVAGVENEAEGTLTFFLVNRNGEEELDVELSLQGYRDARVLEHQVMTHDDLNAVNTAANPDNVAPRQGQGAVAEEDKLSVSLPPHSYQMVRVSVARG
ncbi:alpha-N-arabinofuranosidase [Devosia sp. 919]|uniref:arabinosylfuranosidase ArfA n=1 Tax=Devosia sp. 919 TaxID=2726065 RepID=UPI0015557657